jgi:CRP-like cAMP-binding protein
MRTTSFLRNVPVLAGLSDQLLETVAAQVGQRHVRANDWVMRDGEPADSMFIVRGGSR